MACVTAPLDRAAVPLDEEPREAAQVFRFRRREAARADEREDLALGELRELRGRPCAREERRRDEVHARVRRLRGEHDRDEQRERVRVRERDRRRGVVLGELRALQDAR